MMKWINDLPTDCAELAQSMSDISEKSICAGWNKSLEHSIWQAIKNGPGEYNLISVSEENVKQLNALSKKANSWIVFVDGIGLVTVPLSEWIKYTENPNSYPLQIAEYISSQHTLNNLSVSGIILPEELHDSIKSKILFFDKIIVADFPGKFQRHNDHISVGYYLPETGEVFEYPNGLQPLQVEDNYWLNDPELFMGYEVSRLNTYQDSTEIVLIENIISNGNRVSVKPLLRRLASAQLRRLHGVNAISCSSIQENVLSCQSNKSSTIINLSISKFGIPSDNVPFETIKDFKSEIDNQRGIIALRSWITEISKSELSFNEIAEKLEWLIMEHEKSLKICDIKHNRGTIESIVVTTAEIAEELIKFKWGSLAKSMFSITKSKAALLEAEMNSPGYQIAYILKTREKFKL